ncbi:HAMP domain-containing protein [Lactonifactor sp. BIOML-A3]|uniref:HAMP domain-containing sensor histidine kinase n=1 Tax=unclassified Lactonifactor TaxID=2636670 RepID=UPI0012AF1E2E|nr:MULTISPECIES: HAMP domain-containing sensor histidine kinase [unclassified Lactonifactor]MSA03760.1 HAMP domain-containing protein [Lactonifactor sp. BIOML-A5]MSA10217.1 HAMP domain-containing protein [Lactonifactor sp. BIOML-A4]MSA14767.1 HAMP domain-containing protein [Lactonifactor sp. BIOML-A3]MSA19189.1 HAMP domain-containing protein [Lactonifactor sp. BIOML-A2]MSA39863.1 HAMP domain-containing protein [Lactonifactor sp. BIOML-A1]
MECIKRMGLKQAFFWLTFWCLLGGLLLGGIAFGSCIYLRSSLSDTSLELEVGPETAMRFSPPAASGAGDGLSRLLSFLQFALPALFLTGGLVLANILFYRYKLKKPIADLTYGAEKVIANDLDFIMPEASRDELGQLCRAFETMQKELLRNKRDMWRQNEDRRHLNAAFSHELRNPVTVLKGSLTLLAQDPQNPETRRRIEVYTRRIEQYVEAMSSVQQLEQLPVRYRETRVDTLIRELKETVKILSLEQQCDVEGEGWSQVYLDTDLFSHIAENLIGNAARFAKRRIHISLSESRSYLTLTVSDDGPGYPEEILKNGPCPFQRGAEEARHYGMGLYISKILCEKMEGKLYLNNTGIGARASAVFMKLPHAPCLREN